MFVPNVLSDFNIPWGDEAEWQKRIDKADDDLKPILQNLAYNWKLAWNNARSPYLTMQLLKVVTGQDEEIDSLWEKLTQQSEYQFVLVGSQTLAYTGLYFAYENFLTECCAFKLNKKTSAIGGIKKAMPNAFSATVEQKVWSDSRVAIARYARNDLVHNGGKPGENLLSANSGLIHQGKISIHPVDVAQLFQTLKEKVDIIIGEWK